MDCSNCGGSGKEKCIVCDGTGKVVNMVGGLLGTSSWTVVCSECQGELKMTCRVCRGTGTKPIRQPGEKCAKCHGSGKIMCLSYLCLGTGHYMGPMGLVICSMCGGSGRMNCDDCRGTGYY